MAFGEKYRCEFTDDGIPVELGYTRTSYTVKFLFDGYTGPVIPVRPDYDPWTERIQGSLDNRFLSMLPEVSTFRIIAEDALDAKAFYVNDDQEVQVIVESKTGVGFIRLEWAGWLQPAEIKEPFADAPYPIEVNAVCGLMLLKDRVVADPAGKRFIGLPTVLDVFKSSLAITKLGLPLTTACSLYEVADLAVGQTVGGKAHQDRDPLARTKINATSLVTDQNETKSAYTALEDLLNLFGCRLAQHAGDWVIIRASEAAGGWNVWESDPQTIMTRRYNPGFVGSSSKDLNVNIGKDRNVQVLTGGITFGLPIEQALSVKQVFGGYANRLVNGDFSQVANNFPTGWTNQLFPTDQVQCLGTGVDNDPYRVRIYGSGTNRVTQEFRAIQQRYFLPEGQRRKTVRFRLKGQFRLKNVRSAMVWVTAQKTDIAQGQYVLQQGGKWKLSPPAREMLMLTISHVYRVPGKAEGAAGWQHEKAGWADIDIPMDAINDIQSIVVSLSVAEALDGQTSNPLPYIEYRDMRVEVVEDGQVLDGITATKKRKPESPKPDPALTIPYGDVPDSAAPYDRSGTLYKADSLAPTTKWFPPGADVITQPQLGFPLIDWRLSERADQRMRYANVFQGTLIGKLPWGVHSILRFDVYSSTVNGTTQAIPFQISQYERSRRHGLHRVTAIQMQQVAIDRATTKVWNTPDGDIEFEEDEYGYAYPPTIPKYSTGTQRILELLGKLSNVDLSKIQNPTFPGHTFDPDIDEDIFLDQYNGPRRVAVLLSKFSKILNIDFLVGN
ncbi:hypothetical protein [Spirosoma fluminis]